MKSKCFYCKHKFKTIDVVVTCNSCNYNFCLKHSTKHSHNCKVINKEIHKKLIEKNNPKVINSKIDNKVI